MTDLFARFGRFCLFVAAVGRRCVSLPFFPHEVMKHLYVTTIRCVGPVCATTFPFGMVVALQGLQIFALYGAHRMTPSIITIAVLRELSPVLASVLVAAQGGSSVAAELGAMRIKEEIDATEVMAVDALRFHVVPRVLGLTLACPLLNVMGAFAGIAGGFTSAVYLQGEAPGIFMAELWAMAVPLDLYGGLLKTTIFGLIIGLVATWHGFYATGGAEGVGRAVNDTVVRAALAFIAANYVLTTLITAGINA